MRYVVVSDIHGEYDKLIMALEDIDFNCRKDCLVAAGDMFDRGKKSLQVLDFIMDLPNRIIIRGNHDIRLKSLIDNGGYYCCEADLYNGVGETMKSFIRADYEIKNQFQLKMAIRRFVEEDEFKNTYEKLKQYFNEGVNAVEFKKFIVTHGWLPRNYENIKNKTGFKALWEKAIWVNSEEEIRAFNFPSKKTLVVGHWHVFRFYEFLHPELRDCFYDRHFHKKNFFSVEKENEVYKFWAIDGCVSIDFGVVNTFVINAKEQPLIIKNI